MLSEFFGFIKKHLGYMWVHWNMRDMNYGFEAIENRYIVLGGRPELIESKHKCDLARTLVNKYGSSYIEHPRLEKLIDKNGITKKDFLAGAEEAKAFENKEFLKLHQSTLRKVDAIDTILGKEIDGNLKTNSKLLEIYGITPEGISQLFKEHWFFSLLGAFFLIIIGIILEKIIN